MNGLNFTRFADVIAIPPISPAGLLLPVILIIAVITAAVLLIRHFKNKK